jgi:hypothetical protein
MLIDTRKQHALLQQQRDVLGRSFPLLPDRNGTMDVGKLLEDFDKSLHDRTTGTAEEARGDGIASERQRFFDEHDVSLSIHLWCWIDESAIRHSPVTVRFKVEPFPCAFSPHNATADRAAALLFDQCWNVDPALVWLAVRLRPHGDHNGRRVSLELLTKTPVDGGNGFSDHVFSSCWTYRERGPTRTVRTGLLSKLGKDNKKPGVFAPGVTTVGSVA